MWGKLPRSKQFISGDADKLGVQDREETTHTRQDRVIGLILASV